MSLRWLVVRMLEQCQEQTIIYNIANSHHENGGNSYVKVVLSVHVLCKQKHIRGEDLSLLESNQLSNKEGKQRWNVHVNNDAIFGCVCCDVVLSPVTSENIAYIYTHTQCQPTFIAFTMAPASIIFTAHRHVPRQFTWNDTPTSTELQLFKVFLIVRVWIVLVIVSVTLPITRMVTMVSSHKGW